MKDKIKEIQKAIQNINDLKDEIQNNLDQIASYTSDNEHLYGDLDEELHALDLLIDEAEELQSEKSES